MKNVIHKPNFFLIGMPKSGTTALSEYLRMHPNVFFSDPKEPGYFATDFNVRLITREQDYLRLFQKVESNKHLAVGEGSVFYILSQVAITNILKFQPNARFILMLRDPARLVISLHATVLREGNETIPAFIDAWNAEEERRQGKRIPAGCRDPKWLFYSEWGRLGSHLKRLLEIVPRERVKVILFDDFVQDTLVVYQDVLAFLGLPDDGRREFPKVNERRMPRNLILQSSLGTLMRFWIPLRTKLTLGRGFGLGDTITRWNTVTSEEVKMPEVHRMLVEFYTNEVSLLESLLGRDLSSWRGADQ